MTLDDLTSKRNTSNPSHSVSELKSNTNTNHFDKHQDKSKKIRRIQTSVRDFLHRHHSHDGMATSQHISVHPFVDNVTTIPSTSSSDIQRPLTTKSITFASIFDLQNDDVKENKDFEVGVSFNNDVIPEEDIVNVIENRQTLDDITGDAKTDVEPYPFRSEVPFTNISQSNSSENPINGHSHHQKKNILQQIIHHHHHHHHQPKKLHQPIKIEETIKTTKRSNSAPNLAALPPLTISTQPSLQIVPVTTTSATNQQERQKKPFRKWLRLSTVNRFVHSINRKHNENQQTDTDHRLPAPRRRSTGLRRLSELLY